MTSPTDRFQVNDQAVLAQVFGDEVVMINLTTGVYFSLGGAGTTIWPLLEAGHSLEQVADAVSHRYDIDPGRAISDVVRLADELVDAQLVVAADRPQPELEDFDGEVLPYAEPLLSDFGDMGDLLALDPPMPGIVDTPWTDPKPADSPGDQ